MQKRIPREYCILLPWLAGLRGSLDAPCCRALLALATLQMHQALPLHSSRKPSTGALTATFVCPLDVLKTRMQLGFAAQSLQYTNIKCE